MPVTFKRAKEIYAEVSKVAEHKFNTFKASDWTFKQNARKKALGVCNYHKGTIEVSKFFLEVNTEEQVRNTITHEVAHAVVGWRADHGPAWKAAHIALGGDGKQYACATSGDTYSVVPRYMLVDTTRNQVVKHFHRKPTRNYAGCIIRGRNETLGKLKVVTFEEGKKFLSKQQLSEFGM